MMPTIATTLQLARRSVSAITAKEFAIIISEANLTLNKQERC
jgi:hypothetical protein